MDRIIIGLLKVIFSVIVCITICFIIRKLFPITKELSRKLVHFSLLAVLTVWTYAFDDYLDIVISVFVISLIIYILFLILKKFNALSFFSSIAAERSNDELRKSLVAVSVMFMIVIGIDEGIFDSRTLALASIYAWGPGDAMAALIGKKYGKTKIGKEKKKSFEGTLAMFIFSFISVLLTLLINKEYALYQAIIVSTVTALVTSIVELHVTSAYDTFFCPISAMIVLIIMKILIK